MGFRNIKIEQKMHLCIEDAQLIINSNEEIHIPLEDINSILIENQAVTLSSYFLQKVADYGIALYVCDDKHMPTTVLLPMVKHSRHFKMLKCQIEASKPLQKRLWQQVILRKVQNQALCLELLKLDGAKELFTMSKEIQSGDKTHVEAKAAAFYFKKLYGNDFTRGNDYMINSALNYGYAIIRGFIARAVICFGLEPSLGIFHHSELNSYNLADDMIEPFRPLVDLYVAQNFDISEVDCILSPKMKRGIYNIVNYDMSVKGEKRIVGNCVDLLIGSYSSALQSKRIDMDLPELMQLQVHSYE